MRYFVTTNYLWSWITAVFFACCNFIMELICVILATAKVHFGIGVGEGSEEKEYGEMLCPHLEIIFTSTQTCASDCFSPPVSVGVPEPVIHLDIL